MITPTTTAITPMTIHAQVGIPPAVRVTVRADVASLVVSVSAVAVTAVAAASAGGVVASTGGVVLNVYKQNIQNYEYKNL